MVAENKGVLSWTTPDIDSTELINKILTTKAKNSYLKSNTSALNAQTKLYYGSIITGVDPKANVTYTSA